MPEQHSVPVIKFTKSRKMPNYFFLKLLQDAVYLADMWRLDTAVITKGAKEAKEAKEAPAWVHVPGTPFTVRGFLRPTLCALERIIWLPRQTTHTLRPAPWLRARARRRRRSFGISVGGRHCTAPDRACRGTCTHRVQGTPHPPTHPPHPHPCLRANTCAPRGLLAQCLLTYAACG